MSESIVTISGLGVHYPISGGWFSEKRVVRAVDNINMDIKRGQFFGLVGESGSGKTTLGRAILQAAPITEGSITFHEGERDFDIKTLKGKDLLDYRRQAQLIFQDPYAALSPRMTVRDIIAEPLEVMKLTKDKEETNQRVREIAAECRLNIEHLRRFPHAFSGGQRQRISIARALVSNPGFMVADESVAALDVSIQADILNLLKALQQEHGLTFLFISHDLSVVAHVCDVVAVMYLGQIVELASTRSLFKQPRHPYTAALLSAIPSLDPDDDSDVIKLDGEIPSPLSPPSGCRFHTRCPHAKERCSVESPEWKEIDDDHFVSCHFTNELTL